ncbi:hypothetical protein ABZX85_48205 [Streptomyces sp. NPDC004539]|uniref:hypothetical protein n=1 Tax=Streptomyces sp. NPDC004539 TaxID=3154280 RepID=UPI0033B2F124
MRARVAVPPLPKDFVVDPYQLWEARTHTAHEQERAGRTGEPLIGVNARDLTTLKADRNVFRDLAPHTPEDAVRLAESGVGGDRRMSRVPELGRRRRPGQGSLRTLGRSAAHVGARVHRDRGGFRPRALMLAAVPQTGPAPC